MFNWFKSDSKKSDQNDDESPIEVGVVSETLAHLLTENGNYPLDLDPVEASVHANQFASWANHVLTADPVPGLKPSPTKQRQWKALQKFFSEHRRSEFYQVTAGFSDLRQLLWTFVKVMGSSLHQEKSSDDIIVKQLARLKTALTSSSVEDIKKEAAPAIQLISQLTQDRQKRQVDHLKSLGQKLKELRNELDQARKQLEVDSLTRLYNRKAFDQQISRISDLSVFAGKPTTLMMLDIDHFKKINDSYGHPGGDEVLRTIGTLFIDSFPRKSDFVARYGGEEFAIILQEDGADVAQTLAAKLVAKIRDAQFVFETKTIPVTISVGVAELQIGESPESWVKRADEALYKAKKEGRDRVVCV